MKSIKKMAVAALLALSSAGLASATTYHVSGSTAFRTAVIEEEINLCGGTSAKATYYQTATPGGTVSVGGASYSVIENSSGSLIFENSFTGSIAGDTAIVNSTLIDFPTATDFPPTAITTAPVAPSSVTYNGGTKAAGGTAEAGPTPAASGPNSRAMYPYADVQTTADIIFSDVSFDTAQQVLQSIGINGTPTATTINTGNIVGVIPFDFVANGSSDGSVTDLASMNMDPQKFTDLYSAGTAPLSLFTGVNADENILVYALGRDIDSGTRATSLAESGDGLNGSGNIVTPVVQWYPYDTEAHYNSDAATSDGPNDDQYAGFSTTTGVIGDDTNAGSTTGWLGLVPEETVDGVQLGDGDGGYYTGYLLAVAMGSKVNITKTVMVAYLGVGDAKSALTLGASYGQNATLLPYNGVTFSPTTSSLANSQLIYEGKYTFWGYEHVYYTSAAKTEASQIATDLLAGYDAFSSNDVFLSKMEVARSDDGQNVQPNAADTAFSGNTPQ